MMDGNEKFMNFGLSVQFRINNNSKTVLTRKSFSLTENKTDYFRIRSTKRNCAALTKKLAIAATAKSANSLIR